MLAHTLSSTTYITSATLPRTFWIKPRLLCSAHHAKLFHCHIKQKQCGILLDPLEFNLVLKHDSNLGLFYVPSVTLDEHDIETNCYMPPESLIYLSLQSYLSWGEFMSWRHFNIPVSHLKHFCPGATSTFPYRT